MNQEQRRELETKLKQIKVAAKKIRENNYTRKTTEGMYPLDVGYATAVRRPFRDLLKWMKGVEEMLETIITEEVG